MVHILFGICILYIIIIWYIYINWCISTYIYIYCILIYDGDGMEKKQSFHPLNYVRNINEYLHDA